MEPEVITDCVFCKIIARQIPANIVYEDESTLAFLDSKPDAPGHTLVLPKAHIRNIFEASEPMLGLIMGTAKKVSLALRDSLRAEGVNLIMNNETAAGQIVFHSHLHVIPRHVSDGINYDPRKESYVYGEGEAENLASTLNSALN